MPPNTHSMLNCHQPTVYCGLWGCALPNALEVQPGLLSQRQDLGAGVGVAKMEHSEDSLKAPRSSHHYPLSILSPLSSPLVATMCLRAAQVVCSP